jgi:hypothetical protein
MSSLPPKLQCVLNASGIGETVPQWQVAVNQSLVTVTLIWNTSPASTAVAAHHVSPNQVKGNPVTLDNPPRRKHKSPSSRRRDFHRREYWKKVRRGTASPIIQTSSASHQSRGQDSPPSDLRDDSVYGAGMDTPTSVMAIDIQTEQDFCDTSQDTPSSPTSPHMPLAPLNKPLPSPSNFNAGLDISSSNPAYLTIHQPILSAKPSDIAESVDSNCDSSDSERIVRDNDSPSNCEASDIAEFPRKLNQMECQESLDQWRSNIISWLAEDTNFEPFLMDCTWNRKTSSKPLRGFADDPLSGKSASSKALALGAMLAHVSNLCPVINPRTICERTTSMDNIWQLVFTHFGCKL